jgi:hypothetical protein
LQGADHRERQERKVVKPIFSRALPGST